MKQDVLMGKPASGGVAQGTALVTFAPPPSAEKDGASPYVLADFQRAVKETRNQLNQFQQSMQERMAEAASQIFAVHLAFLEDPQFVGRIQEEIEEGVPVQKAIHAVTDACIDALSRVEMPRAKEKIDDMNDISRRLLARLTGRSEAGLNASYEGRILIVQNLLPSEIFRFAAQKAEGLILTSGGVTAHISILARGLQIPMILADPDLIAGISSGTSLLMDAHAGKIYIAPDPQVVSEYAKLLQKNGKVVPGELEIKPQTITKDGQRIHLLSAVGFVSESKLAYAMRAEGIGLYRSEIPFLIRNDFPSEDEQVGIYRKILEEMKEGELVFRTLDVGGDKMLRYFEPDLTESNPFLGLRGIRFTLRNPEIFRTQVRAMLRAGHDRPLKILFPLVSSVDSFRRVRSQVAQFIEELTAENVPIVSNPECGAMIELPSAIAMANELASEADFLSIGTNDLIQYMLAVDRTNPQVAGWHVPWHPAILRSIKTVLDAARDHQKSVSICGDMASDPTMIPILIGMGATNLTVPPWKLANVQQWINNIDAGAAEKLAKEVLTVATLEEIADILQVPLLLPDRN